jgi:opacity protein-like surface antigen
MKKLISIAVLYGFLISAPASAVLANEGFYLGLGIPYNTIGGDFDGESVFVGASDLIIVPEIDGALGFGILGGYQANNGLAFELSYLASSHDAKWLGASGDVDYSVVNLDFKYNFSTDRPTQPYLLLGLGLHEVVVVDGSVSVSGQIGDATYTGTGFNIGAGVDQYVNPNVSIGLGLTYRIVEYDEAEGVVGKGKLDDSLNGDGFGLVLDAAYHF